MIRRLRRKFILINLLLVGVVLTVVFVLLVASNARRYADQSQAAMRMALSWREDENPRFEIGAPPPDYNPSDEGSRFTMIPVFVVTVEDGIVTGETADTIMAYMAAVEEAKAITTDINARYEAFANAEAMLIQNALVIPMGMSVPAYLATRLNYWEGQYASTGFSNKRLKGIHVLDHYVSMSEYEANRDAR